MDLRALQSMHDELVMLEKDANILNVVMAGSKALLAGGREAAKTLVTKSPKGASIGLGTRLSATRRLGTETAKGKFLQESARKAGAGVTRNVGEATGRLYRTNPLTPTIKAKAKSLGQIGLEGAGYAYIYPKTFGKLSGG